MAFLLLFYTEPRMQQTEGRPGQAAQAGERITQNFGELIPCTSQSQWPRGLKRGVCRRSLAGIVSSNTAEGMDICLSWMLFSGTGLCVGLITGPEEFYKLWCVKQVWSRCSVMVDRGSEWGRKDSGGGNACTKVTLSQRKGNRKWLIWGLPT
jgi:hypothetical protein